MFFFFFFQAEDGIRDVAVTGVQTCALPICLFRCDRNEPALCPLPDSTGGSHEQAKRTSERPGPTRRAQIGRASCREREYFPGEVQSAGGQRQERLTARRRITRR